MGEVKGFLVGIAALLAKIDRGLLGIACSLLTVELSLTPGQRQGVISSGFSKFIERLLDTIETFLIPVAYSLLTISEGLF